MKTGGIPGFRRPRRPTLAGAVALLLGIATVLSAQNNNAPRTPPHLAYAYPAGARQGTRLTIHLGGQRLAQASGVTIPGGGVTAKISGYERPLTPREAGELREKIEALRKERTAAPAAFPAEKAAELTGLMTTAARRGNRQANPALAETVTLELTVAADAPLGNRELRLLTPNGLSNPLVFQIGVLPEFAAPVTTPTSPGAAGKRRPDAPPPPAVGREIAVSLPAVVNGQILPGEVDRIRFPARRGQQIVATVAARELIPYLADAVPGWFQARARLCDAQGRELAYNDDFQFRPDPVLACVIPADGDYVLEITDAIYRGREDFVYRASVGELPFVRSVFPLGASRTRPVHVELTGWNLPATRQRVEAGDKSTGIMQLHLNRDGIPSNRVRFAVGEAEEMTEPEDADHPAVLPGVPGVFNGRIAAPSEKDIVRFRGRKGERIVAEIFARRLDSPLDSHLLLQDAKGRTLAVNDDFDDRTEGLVTHQADSRLLATLPADGDFTLVVTDTQRRGGPEFGYRLSLAPARPDFSLRVTPSALSVSAGGNALLTVFAVRQDGFTGEIILGLRGETTGFALHGARIPAGRDSIQLTLAAPARTVPVASSLRLMGTAVIDGQTVTHPAAPADDMMQAFLYRHLVPAENWQVVIGARAPPVRPGSTQTCMLEPARPARIRFTLPYLPRNVEEVRATLVDPPPGVSVGRTQMIGRNTLEVELLAEPCHLPAEREGNLVFSLQNVRDQPSGNAARGGRPFGLAPAVPYARVITPAPPTGKVTRTN